MGVSQTVQQRIDSPNLTTFQILWLLVVIAMIGDGVTTMIGLSIGLAEHNPFVAPILADYGMLGLVGLKTLVVLWCLATWKILGLKYGKAALLGLFIPQFIATVLNVVTIAQA